jgi:hypothetical protein
MVEEEFDLVPGTAQRLLAGDHQPEQQAAAAAAEPAPAAKLAEEPAAGSSAN